MRRIFSPVTTLSFVKKLSILALVSYSALSTVLLLKLKPTPILIGVDHYGTRLITVADDSLLRREKENFVKLFISQIYSFDQTTFSEQVSKAGDLMSQPLWNEKKEEFAHIAEKITDAPLSQQVQILELRQSDDNAFQADLKIQIDRKLTKTEIKIRLDLKIHPHARSNENPYPFEVEQYDEQSI